MLLRSILYVLPVLATQYGKKVLHQRQAESTSAWIKRTTLPSDHVLEMRIALSQRNVENAEDILMGVSDPHSARYGKHYSRQEVNDIFRPSAESDRAVREWLQTEGNVTNITTSKNGQWLLYKTTLATAQKLFDTQYHIYDHEELVQTDVGCDVYYVPDNLSQHIDFVLPGVPVSNARAAVKRSVKLQKRSQEYTRLNAAAAARQPQQEQTTSKRLEKRVPGRCTTLKDASLLAGNTNYCSSCIFPECIAGLYNISASNKNRTPNPSNYLGLYESLGDEYDVLDLSSFFADTDIAAGVPVTTRPKVIGVNRGTAPASPTATSNTGETNLDLEIAYPIVYPQTITIYEVGVYSNSDSGWFNYLLYDWDYSYWLNSSIDYQTANSQHPQIYYDQPGSVSEIPRVLSISYSGAEAALDSVFAARECLEFLKLGLMGTTIFISSGDNGVSANNGYCGYWDDTHQGIFIPQFPAACPWVTSVGATLLTSDLNTGSEVATTSFGSGAGFANSFGRPSYQDSAVTNYYNSFLSGYLASMGTTVDKLSYVTQLNSTFPPGESDPRAYNHEGQWNRDGRGIPDVSALGDNILGYFAGTGIRTLSGGTSAAAPLWASVINRINEERLANGLSTLGFLNPILYQHPEFYKDITVGSSFTTTKSGCAKGGIGGFPAAVGWDPVTGLGTPKYDTLLKVLATYGTASASSSSSMLSSTSSVFSSSSTHSSILISSSSSQATVSFSASTIINITSSSSMHMSDSGSSATQSTSYSPSISIGPTSVSQTFTSNELTTVTSVHTSTTDSTITSTTIFPVTIVSTTSITGVSTSVTTMTSPTIIASPYANGTSTTSSIITLTSTTLSSFTSTSLTSTTSSNTMVTTSTSSSASISNSIITLTGNTGAGTVTTSTSKGSIASTGSVTGTSAGTSTFVTGAVLGSPVASTASSISSVAGNGGAGVRGGQISTTSSSVGQQTPASGYSDDEYVGPIHVIHIDGPIAGGTAAVGPYGPIQTSSPIAVGLGQATLTALGAPGEIVVQTTAPIQTQTNTLTLAGVGSSLGAAGAPLGGTSASQTSISRQSTLAGPTAVGTSSASAPSSSQSSSVSLPKQSSSDVLTVTNPTLRLLLLASVIAYIL